MEKKFSQPKELKSSRSEIVEQSYDQPASVEEMSSNAVSQRKYVEKCCGQLASVEERSNQLEQEKSGQSETVE